MKIFLDDIRNPPDDSWTVLRTADQVIRFLAFYDIEEISFDHDLGDDENGTGYDVAKYIEEQCFYGYMKCPKWMIHSANPVGRENIKSAMNFAEYCTIVNEREKSKC